MPDTDSTVTVDSQQAVHWAETADGTRDKTLYLVQTDARKIAVKKEDDMSKGDVCIAKFFTPLLVPKRPTSEVTLACEGAEIPLKDCDTVFWTESSAAKFLWPYYHSHRIYDEKIAACQRAFEKDATVIAIVHTPLTHTRAISLKLVVHKTDGSINVMSLEEFELWSKSR